MTANIIDYVECDACNGKGELPNETFQALPPEKRLEYANDPNFNIADHIGDPMQICPFCVEGQAPIYECEQCSGDGCDECEQQGWYQ